MYNTWVSDIKKFVLEMLALALNLTEFYFSHFQTSYNQVLYIFCFDLVSKEMIENSFNVKKEIKGNIELKLFRTESKLKLD